MVRSGDWKYIFMANGGREQLFNLKEDPQERTLRNADAPQVLTRLRRIATEGCFQPGVSDALEGADLKKFPYTQYDRKGRIAQMDRSRGVEGFPSHPADVLEGWEFDI